jgi:hypothetical protein
MRRLLHEPRPFRLHRKDETGKPLKYFDRLDLAVRRIVGKRLTWHRLTVRFWTNERQAKIGFVPANSFSFLAGGFS